MFDIHAVWMPRERLFSWLHWLRDLPEPFVGLPLFTRPTPRRKLRDSA
jgi:hypothetical protein